MTRTPPLRLLLVLAQAVIIQAIVYAMRPSLSYAALDAGASPALLGVISAAFALPGLLLALPVGHVNDRFGERWLLVAGAASILAATVLALTGLASVALIIVATALLGLGHLVSLIGQQAMVGNTTNRRKFDSIFGLYTFSASVGQTLGPLLLVLPGGTESLPPLHLIFLTCGALSLAMLAMSPFMHSSPRDREGTSPGMLNTAGTLLRTPGLPQSLIATSIVLSSLDIFLAYTPALGHERGISTGVVSAMLVARSVMSMASRLSLGRMVLLAGRRRLLISTISVSALALACIALPLPPPWLVVLSGVYGFVMGTCQPITLSWVSDLAPPGTRGLAMSMRLASNRLGQTAIPATVGTFASATGAPGVLVATSVLLAFAAWSSSAVPNGGDDSAEAAPAP